METKRQLRAQRDALQFSLTDLEAQLENAGWTASGAWSSYDAIGGLGWKPPESNAAEVETRIRRETLTTVIDALGLKGYAAGGYIPSGPTIYDTDRLWTDLQTTLRVRSERKATEADAKVEERVSGLLKTGDGVRASDDYTYGSLWAKYLSDPGPGSSYGSAVTLDGTNIAQAVKNSNAKPKKGGKK